MEIRVLRYFLMVARESNITKAASFLHITQPTLSRQLKALEDELGVKLFIRSNYNIRLTDDGMLLRKRAQEMLDLANKTTAEFSPNHKAISGDIYLGGGETIAVRYIAKALKKLRHEYPDIHYHMFSGDGNDVAEHLDKGLIDFGLFVGLTDLKNYNYLKIPTEDTWGLVMRQDDSLAQHKSIQPKDLEGIALLYSRQALAQNELADWLGYSPENVHIIGTHNLTYNAAIMVREGVGYALSLDGIINTVGGSDLCFRPLEPKKTAQLVIAWKKNQLFSKAAEAFLETMQLELQQNEDI